MPPHPSPEYDLVAIVVPVLVDEPELKSTACLLLLLKG